MSTIIETKNLSKIYNPKKNPFTALDTINLSIDEGEAVAIVGKSGSGKSTLMHILALLDRPTNGTLLIDGQDTTTFSERQLASLRGQRYAFIFQQFFLLPKKSVLENVMLPLKIGGISRTERKKRAMTALEAVELTDKANNKAVDLSGGQKQRVAIARSIANNPKVIFADEPTGNLDSKTGEQIESILLNLHKKGITVIAVTHDVDFAKKFMRQIVLADGSLISDRRKKS